MPFTLEMATPNHLTRFVNLTPTLATPLQKENVLVMPKKRVGSRLRNVKSQYKGKKLSDSKGIGGGKGRLTNEVMNTLQNHYGIAIRQNTHNLYAMRKAVAAVLHHSTKNDDMDKRHQYCPRTADSWCKYQRDKITEKILMLKG